MITKISADWIYPITSDPIKEGVVILNEEGSIVDINTRNHHDLSSIQIYKGAICPGFINAHCHLELSHLKGTVASGTGLIPFITSVVKNRDADINHIYSCIEEQDRFMWESGTQAVGDISNSPHTSATKSNSNIRYHTFIEMFDFLNPEISDSIYRDYMKSYESMAPKKSDKLGLTPHAPYTVSKALFKIINDFNVDKDVSVSLHNQETPDENKLFLSKTGAFTDFYNSFNITLEHFEKPNTSSLKYALSNMDSNKKTLLVHNTMSTKEDIQHVQSVNHPVYWVSCPNANLYIENKLPDYKLFIDENQSVALGTDSLTSNWQLSILEEMKTIHKYNSYIPVDILLSWATINGAVALGFGDNLGSIEIGKSPGLVLITANENGIDLTSNSVAKRLF